MDDVEDMDDLLAILKCAVDLDEMKDFIKNKLDQLEQEEVKRVCIQSVPLDYIISTDVLQSVLGFLPYQHSVKMVNKNFNALSKKNKPVSMDAERLKTVDWTLVIQEKREEIKRMIQQRDHGMEQVKSKYDDLIRRSRSHLQ